MTVYRMKSYEHSDNGEIIKVSIFPDENYEVEPVEIYELAESEKNELLENIVETLQYIMGSDLK